jgi:fructose-1,6-bisphosphatase I
MDWEAEVKVGMSLTAWVLHQQAMHPGARGQLSMLLTHVSLAARLIAAEVARAPLSGLVGYAGATNVQGEEQAKLDIVADELFLEAMGSSDLVSTMVSEEREDPEYVDGPTGQGNYTIFYDPLDGSSNIDVNVTVGSIFGVYRQRPNDRGRLEDLFRPGSDQVAAGYVMYGASTILVLATEDSNVHGFTLRPEVGEFFLTHPDMQMPTIGKSYAANQSREPHWTPEMVEVVRRFQTAKVDGKKRTARYVGSLIADFHRTLLKGGIFMYPGEIEKPAGKLRLMYEAAPLAFIAEKAGGGAHDGKVRILDKVATTLHERTPLIIGSRVDVDDAFRVLNPR